MERQTTDVLRTKSIRLLLLDEHSLFRESLSRVLGLESDLDIAGQCSTFGEALEILASVSVEVILSELDLGEGCMEDFVVKTRKSSYQGKFLVVAAAIEGARAAALVKLGVAGIFLKCGSSEQLLQAIRQVAIGEA